MPSRKKPRKKPRQVRSELTVDALVEATGQVLEKEGYERITTTRVADRAGVSVGSLYQYFPGKEALIAAFIERRLHGDIEMMQRIAGEAGSLGPGRFLLLACTEMVELYRRERDLYAQIMEVIPMFEQVDEVRAGLRRAVSLTGAFLAARSELLGGRDPQLVALVGFHAVRSSLNAVLLEAPERLDDPELPVMLADLALAVAGIDPDAFEES